MSEQRVGDEGNGQAGMEDLAGIVDSGSGGIICPECGSGDRVEKVSAIYVTGLEAKRKPAAAQEHGQGGTRLNPALSDIPAAELTRLSRRLAPPAGEKQTLRSVHPDLAVLVFSLVALIFLYGMLTSQQGMLIPALALLTVGYAIYFWKRKGLMEKFEYQRTEQRDAAKVIRRGIERWMRLYYCVRDDGVFTPGDEHLTPADQISGYLFQR
jgi:hypothetical protein